MTIELPVSGHTGFASWGAGHNHDGINSALPRLPYISVRASAAQNIPGDLQWHTLQMDTIIKDTHSLFNTGTYSFVANANMIIIAKCMVSINYDYAAYQFAANEGYALDVVGDDDAPAGYLINGFTTDPRTSPSAPFGLSVTKILRVSSGGSVFAQFITLNAGNNPRSIYTSTLGLSVISTFS